MLINGRLRPRYKTVPLEVLQLIFAELFPYHSKLFDCSTPFGSREMPWLKALRMQTALVLVCKDWHRAALPFLYRHVVLPGVDHILAFSHTLRSDTRGYATPLVRSLTMYGIVPDCLAPRVNAAVSQIVSQCTSLRRLSLDHSFVDEAELAYTRGSDNQFLSGFLGSVRYQPFALDLRPYQIVRRTMGYVPGGFVADFPNLTSLSIVGDSQGWGSNLEFPSLEVLSLWQCDPRDPHELPSIWSLPKLKDLRFRPSFKSPDHQQVDDFFNRYGQGITHLDLGCRAQGRPLEDVEKVVSLCPMLEHLVLSESYTYEDADDIQGRRSVCESVFAQRPLEFVDVCISLTASVSFDAMASGRNIAENFLPWKTVRILDASLVDLVPDLPHIFPPQRAAGHLPQVHKIFGLMFVQNRYSIYQPPLITYLDDADDERTEIDGDFKPEYDLGDSEDEDVVGTSTTMLQRMFLRTMPVTA